MNGSLIGQGIFVIVAVPEGFRFVAPLYWPAYFLVLFSLPLGIFLLGIGYTRLGWALLREASTEAIKR